MQHSTFLNTTVPVIYYQITMFYKINFDIITYQLVMVIALNMNIITVVLEMFLYPKCIKTIQSTGKYGALFEQ